jgi:hypothetical protein
VVPVPVPVPVLLPVPVLPPVPVLVPVPSPAREAARAAHAHIRRAATATRPATSAPRHDDTIVQSYDAWWMAPWLKRTLPSLLLDVLVVLALALPEVCAYLRWPLLGLYGVLSWALFRTLSANRWIVDIVRDRDWRIAHGLEHATIAVLAEDGLPVDRGYAHGRDRFFVVVRGQGHHVAAIRDAAERAIRRMQAGEHSLAYQPGCGTSEVVFAVTLWLVYVTSMLLPLVIGGSVALFFAISVIVFRFWLACETALGLLAQRLFTVSTAFESARVVDVRELPKWWKWGADREDETCFQIIVEFRVAASEGGLVAPGPLA